MINKLLTEYYKFFPSNNGVIKQFYNKSKINTWHKQNKPLPAPHELKQSIINEYQKNYNSTVLVETGTYLGDMIFAQIPNFKQLFSIELSKPLWVKAVKRFEKVKKVTILQGDSGKVLHDLVPKLQNPTLFWLDGHYSAGITALGEKECPIFEELDAIFKSELKHIILVDDARLFIGSNDYPTIEELKHFVKVNKPSLKFEVLDDTIRITP